MSFQIWEACHGTYIPSQPGAGLRNGHVTRVDPIHICPGTLPRATRKEMREWEPAAGEDPVRKQLASEGNKAVSGEVGE